MTTKKILIQRIEKSLFLSTAQKDFFVRLLPSLSPEQISDLSGIFAREKKGIVKIFAKILASPLSYDFTRDLSRILKKYKRLGLTAKEQANRETYNLEEELQKI